MYYAERLSHKYKYIGNGVVKKKTNNELFKYTGKLDETDGFDVQIVQPNSEDTGGLTDNLSESDYRVKNKRDYTIEVERDFLPRFRLEAYTTKLVVKRINENSVMLDFYTPMYESQFNRMHKPFLNEIDRIYQGFIRSDIIDFKGVRFISYNAFGTDDLKEYKYTNVEFDNIVKFDGDYVLKFTADIVKDGEDLIAEFYDKTADEKSKNHAPRKGKNDVDFMSVKMKMEDTYDVEQAAELVSNIK
jgi:hypothetical protein